MGRGWCSWGGGGLTLQAGGAHPARTAAALSVDGVTGRPVEAGAGLAAVVPVGGGRAGCRREGAIRGRRGRADLGQLGRPPFLWPGHPSAWPTASLSGHLAAADTEEEAPARLLEPLGPPGPHAPCAQRGPQRPAGQRQEPLTESQGAPAAQSQMPRQSRPKKPAGQAAESGERRGRGSCDGPRPGGGVRPPPRPTPQLTAFTEGSPPAGRAGARPADVVTGCPVLTLAPPPTARPEVALGTP